MRIGFLVAAILPAVSVAGCGGEIREVETRDVVVLLHGLGRSDLSMGYMAGQLEEAGYRTVNVGYPSTDHSIEHLAAEELAPALEDCCTDPEGKVHFVAHSMGGIVLRYYLENHDVPNLGRVVMLSPPNQGSEIADWVAESELLQRVMGPAAEQLGTDDESVPSQLGPVDFELGVITGNRTLNPLFSRMIPGADDGKVAVERAKVEGMADFLVVAHTHTYIMLAEDVIEQTVYFLRNGEFERVEEEGDTANAE